MNVQHWIALGVFAVAVVFLTRSFVGSVRSFLRSADGQQTGSCGACHGCGAAQLRTPARGAESGSPVIGLAETPRPESLEARKSETGSR